MTDFNKVKYNQWQTPEYGQFYKDGENKFYLCVKQEDFPGKVPAGFGYLYELRRGVYQLMDFVTFDSHIRPSSPEPPRNIYKQQGLIYIIKSGLPIYTK